MREALDDKPLVYPEETGACGGYLLGYMSHTAEVEADLVSPETHRTMYGSETEDGRVGYQYAVDTWSVATARLSLFCKPYSEMKVS